MHCEIANCKSKVIIILGDCKYCQGHFCSSHRLQEDHKCQGLDLCRRESFERNKEKLMKEKVIVQKI